MGYAPMMNKRITPEEALKRPNSTLPEIDETPPITINSLVYLGALSDPAGPRTHEYALTEARRAYREDF